MKRLTPTPVTLLNRDCFEVMRSLPDHSVDLILTDPPYNIAKYSR